MLIWWLSYGTVHCEQVQLAKLIGIWDFMLSLAEKAELDMRDTF